MTEAMKRKESSMHNQMRKVFDAALQKSLALSYPNNLLIPNMAHNSQSSGLPELMQRTRDFNLISVVKNTSPKGIKRPREDFCGDYAFGYFDEKQRLENVKKLGLQCDIIRKNRLQLKGSIRQCLR
jgi:hypothetical protein